MISRLPWYQKAIRFVAAVAMGYLAFGAVFGIVNNSRVWISPPLTYWGSAVVVFLFLIAAIGVKRFRPRYVVHGQETVLTGLNWKHWATGAALMMLLWVPRALPASLQQITNIPTAVPSGPNLPKQDPVVHTLFLDCDLGSLSEVISPDGRTYVSELSLLPEESSGGGFTTRLSGMSGTELRNVEQQWWKSAIPRYRCALTNYGRESLFDVEMKFQLMFRETANTAGEIKHTREWSLNVPKADAGEERPFLFYLVNSSTYYVEAFFPKRATAFVGGSRERLTIDLLSGPGSLSDPSLVFMPLEKDKF